MQLVLWMATGVLAAVVASVGFRAGSRLGLLGSAGVCAAASLAAALAVDGLLGELARVRVSIISDGAYGSVSFALAPAIAALVCPIAALAVFERLTPSRTDVGSAVLPETTPRT